MWTLQYTTANLADDDHAEDERKVQRHLRDLRSRVKAVRAKVAADPTIQHSLATNPEKAAAFYVIHGVPESQVKHGVPNVDVAGLEGGYLVSILRGSPPWEPVSVDWTGEEAEPATAILAEVVA